MPRLKPRDQVQKYWPSVGVPVTERDLAAIDKAASVESMKRGEPISRARFCRDVLLSDPRIQAVLNGKKKAAQ